MLKPNSTIFVTGHRGLVGSAIVRHLKSTGFSRILTASRSQLDLRNQRAVDDWFSRHQIDFVIHVAGKVGGIMANSTQPADFVYDNTLIHATVLKAAHEHRIKKLLYLGSSCIYPRDCAQPIKEEYLLSGPLERTNDAYAIAKISGLLSCQAYRRQHGCDFIAAMPTNLYGPHDNFDLESAHVLPALMRRMHEAKLAGQDEVVVWGTGNPKREFLHVDDLAAACVFLLENYQGDQPINIGWGDDLSIRQLAETIRDVVYPELTLKFDTSKPDGTPRKLLDVSRINELGWNAKISLVQGIRSTYEWFLENYDRVLDRAAEKSGGKSRPSRVNGQVGASGRQTVQEPTTDPEPSSEFIGRKALVTGITGQDGSYLAELLLSLGYEVHGLVRRNSSINSARIDHLYRDPHEDNVQLHLHYGDLADASSLNQLIDEIKPDEVYNLGAQSHVKVSFDVPEYTADVTALGALRLLESMRRFAPDARFYQASSSELYGQVREIPQSETTPFHPRSPYAIAKEFAFSTTRNFREAYGCFGVNGILFNHESPRRGETFVTRKISRAVAGIVHGLQDCLYLGNLNAKRDWGFAGDYVRAMWMMLQADSPQDYVVASGETHTVREFCELAFGYAGVKLEWQGEGVEEVGLDQTGRTLVRVDPKYFRPAEVDLLLGDSTKIRAELGWQPRVTFQELVEMMVDHDIREVWPGRGNVPKDVGGKLQTSSLTIQ